MTMDKTTDINLVVLGDEGVGKTSLLFTYDRGSFPVEYLPKTYDAFRKETEVDGRAVDAGCWDTTGHRKTYDRLRPPSVPREYANAAIFLICFSVSDPTSYENVTAEWLPEVSYFSPYTPVVLVATKLDLRDDQETIDRLQKNGEAPVSSEQGMAMKKKIGAVEYFECSSRTQQGLKEVFQGAFRAAISNLAKPPAKKCLLL